MKKVLFLVSVSLLTFVSCNKMPDREFLTELQGDGLAQSEQSLETAVGLLVPPMPVTADIVFIEDKDRKSFSRLITPAFSPVHYIEYDGKIETLIDKIQDLPSAVLVSTNSVAIEIAAQLDNVKGLMLVSTIPNDNYLEDCETLLDKRIKTIYVRGEESSFAENVEPLKHGMLEKIIPNSKNNPHWTQPRIVETYLNELI